jgi:DNA replication protein DnaC
MPKETRQLKAELFKKPDASKTLTTPCALDQKLSCCEGQGFLRKQHGAYLQATLCDCVRSCPSCYGRARKLVNGKSRACRTPNPAQVVNILNKALIPARYGGAKLDQFANFTGNGREIVKGIRQWLKEFQLHQPKGLLLGGPVGAGKTYLLAAIAKALGLRGFSVRFIDFFQLLNELKAGYAQDQADANILRELIRVDVLMVDELGKGRNSDWELSIIDQLVMGRYNQNKIVVATTNYSLNPSQKLSLNFSADLTQDPRRGFGLDEAEDLETRVGSRIYSRLVETCLMLELTGDDYRKRFLQDRRNMISPTPNDRRPYN